MKPFMIAAFSLALSSACIGAPIDLGHPSSAPYARTENDGVLVSKRTNQFRQDIRALGFSGEVQSCSSLVVLAVGPPDGNRSYGAVCNIFITKKVRKVLVCDDEMVGHLAINVDVTTDPEGIARFVEQNCYGG